MITPEFVRVPLRVKTIVSYGVGSVKIDKEGNIELLVIGNNDIGKMWQEAFRNGELDHLRIEPIAKEDVSASG